MEATQETVAAPEATTTTSATLLGQHTQVSSVSETVESNETETNTETTFNVPEKFLVDGKPDYEKLVKSYTELEKHLGSKIGVSSADEYDFQFQEPDNWDSEQFTAFKEQAKEWGMSKDQFNNAMALYEESMLQVVEQNRQTPEKAEAALKEVWGKNYESKMQNAGKALAQFGSDEIDINVIGNNPEVIKLLSIIGSQLGEDAIVPASKSLPGAGLSKLEIDALMARPDYFENKEVQTMVSNWYNKNVR